MPREIALEKVRNIGIMAHIDAGKTTTTERILYFTRRTHRIGEVHEGNATMDFMIQEQMRGITISSAATSCRWSDYVINIIDTPGHVDFTIEVERAMRVLDGAIAVFCAKGGVEPQSETVWRQADRYQVPRIAYVNKMDIVGADFFHVLQMMRDRLGADPVALQIPIGAEADFIGIIDLVKMRAFYYRDPTGWVVEEQEIPSSLLAAAQEQRQALLEKASDFDDDLLLKVAEGAEVSEEEIRAAVRRGTIAAKIVPVFCGSSFKNKGTYHLLDAVVDYLPSPEDIGKTIGIDPDDPEIIQTCLFADDQPLAALAFKVTTDDYGRLVYVRVYSGSIKTGTYIYNSAKKRRERVGRLLRMHANVREDIQEAFAGDICAIIGLKESFTGDTLCDEKRPVVLESITFPEPVINRAIELKAKADQDKLIQALQRLSDEDPTFRYYTNEETGQMLIAGMGELHLEIIVDRLEREFQVPHSVGRPQVAYRETITHSARGHGVWEHQAGGRGQFAHVDLEIEPLPMGSGYEYVSLITGSVLPRPFVTAVDLGVREALKNGTLSGSQVIDLKVSLVDGRYHEVDSSEADFKIAASIAFKDALNKAGAILLEPIMQVEITVPQDYLGDVIGDVNSKRGHIEGMETRVAGQQVVRANIPLATMFGYATDLRSRTQGRGTFTMETSHYAEVPKNVAQEILGRFGFTGFSFTPRAP